MRIIEKKEVDRLKTEEKRQQIETGLKLARRVDEIRETRNQEEDALSKYRNETSKIVQGEIDMLIKKKEQLEYDIGVLERQSNVLNRPFDEEWELVKMKRLSDLDEQLESIQIREKELRRKEHDYVFRDSELKLSEDRVNDERLRSEKLLKEATQARDDAHELLNEAKIRESAINQQIEKNVKEYEKKEAEWKSKELDLSMREEALKNSVRELARRERFINDKYQTLLRTEKIVNNQ